MVGAYAPPFFKIGQSNGKIITTSYKGVNDGRKPRGYSGRFYI